MNDCRPPEPVAGQHSSNVQPFAQKDLPALLGLVRKSADLEGYLGDFRVSLDDLRVRGYSKPPQFGAFIAAATDSGDLVGMAVRHAKPWTCDMRPTLVLKEHNVAEGWRNFGVRRARMKSVRDQATRMDGSRIKWPMLAGDEPARKFYRSLGRSPEEKCEPWILELSADSSDNSKGTN